MMALAVKAGKRFRIKIPEDDFRFENPVISEDKQGCIVSVKVAILYRLQFLRPADFRIN